MKLDNVVGGDIEQVESFVIGHTEERRERQLHEIISMKGDACDVLKMVMINVKEYVRVRELRVDTSHRGLLTFTRAVLA